MELILTREGFLKAAGLVSQAVGLKPNLPVLNNILLAVDSGNLELTATNLETTITLRTPAKVLAKGKTTVPARVLVDFFQTAGGEQINLKLVKEKLLIEANKARGVLPTINPSEFPSLKVFDAATSVTVERDKFLEAVSQVAFSAAPEEGRPVLTGVLLTADEKRISLVATDGYRLAKKEIKGAGVFEAVIPAKTLRESVKSLDEQEEEKLELSVNKENNQCRLKTKNLTITSRLLEGHYPNYEQIIPDTFIGELVVDTKELVGAIKLASLFARDVGNVVRLEYGERQLKVEASTAQVGEAETVLAVKHSGEKLKTAFNSRFLLDCLGTIKNKETAISFSGPTSAALFRGKDDTSLMHIVMPVRVQS